MVNFLDEIEDIIHIEERNNSTLKYISLDGLEIDLDMLKAVANVEYDNTYCDVVNKNLMLVYDKTIWLRTVIDGKECFAYLTYPFQFQKPTERITAENEEDLASIKIRVFGYHA